MNFVKELQDIGLDVEDQGHPAEYVGVNIRKDSDLKYHFYQRALIDSIINDIGLTTYCKVKPVPAKMSQQLHVCTNSTKFDLDFNYCSIVGKLNYLSQTTRPDIITTTHMIAKYSQDLRKDHG